MQELREVGQLSFREVGKRWHALFRETLQDRRANPLALLVMQHHDGADQVGPFRATRLFAMTERAVGSVQLLAARGRGRIGRRTESQELPSVAAASAAAPGGRDVLLREQNRRCEQAGKNVGFPGTVHYSLQWPSGTPGPYYRSFLRESSGGAQEAARIRNTRPIHPNDNRLGWNRISSPGV